MQRFACNFGRFYLATRRYTSTTSSNSRATSPTSGEVILVLCSSKSFKCSFRNGRTRSELGGVFKAIWLTNTTFNKWVFYDETWSDAYNRTSSTISYGSSSCTTIECLTFCSFSWKKGTRSTHYRYEWLISGHLSIICSFPSCFSVLTGIKMLEPTIFAFDLTTFFAVRPARILPSMLG